MGNPSIAPKRGGERDAEKEKTHSKTVRGKHRFKSNDTVTAAGNGKTVASHGAGDYSSLAEAYPGSWDSTDSISLRASGVLSEQRLFQVKN